MILTNLSRSIVLANKKVWENEGPSTQMCIWIPLRLKEKLKAKAERSNTSVRQEIVKLIMKVEKYL